MVRGAVIWILLTNERKMNKIITLAVAMLLLSGCGRSTKEEDNKTMEEKMTYLALGDSYTIGEGVAESDRWPVRLANRLAEEGLPFNPPNIIARTGWTTDELMDGIEKEAPAATHDLVSLLIGVNNQYRGRDTANFREEFKELLDLAVDFAGGSTSRILVLSIPDWGVTPFDEGRDRQKIADEIDAFNAIVQQESDRKKALFVDVTAISRLAAEDSTLLAPDGLHPSGEMYGLWVDKALPLVIERIKTGGQ